MLTLTKTVTGRVDYKYLEHRHDMIRLKSEVIHEIFRFFCTVLCDVIVYSRPTKCLYVKLKVYFSNSHPGVF